MSTRSPSRLPSSSSPPSRRAFTLAALVVATAVLGLAWAGNLEPPGPPGPTMKTLDEIPPTWSRVLPADDGDAEGCDSSRFQCVANRQWVLDHQTGLVWARTFSLSFPGFDWDAARTCGFFHDGGWRLPSAAEMGTLRAAPGSSDNRGLPSGHPFLVPNFAVVEFWTMTGSASDPSLAWSYRFEDSPSPSSLFPQEEPKSQLKQRWCVRSPHPGLPLY